MKNSLRELLQRSFPASPKTNHAQNRADVMMRRDEILAELRNGWAMRHIRKALRDAGEITCAYSTFVNQIHRISAEGTNVMGELGQ